MNTLEMLSLNPSPEEAVLLRLEDGNYSQVIFDIARGFYQDRSPSFLSVIRPDLVTGFAKSFKSDENDVLGFKDLDQSWKAELFDGLMPAAREGDGRAISALPKFASSLGQLGAAMELVLEYPDAVYEWRTDRPYLQLLGSFNPQHIGHRATIRSALEAGGEDSSALIQVVKSHPVKKGSLPPYEGRFLPGEEKIYSSPVIDNLRVNWLDMPAGVGLATTGVAQIELLAGITGDNELRWLLGTDKFMKDVKDVKEGRALDKAGARFTDPRVHLYVARRIDHDQSELDEAIDYLETTFGTKVTIVHPSPEANVLAASASGIRLLRAEGREAEADELEFPDLQDLGEDEISRIKSVESANRAQAPDLAHKPKHPLLGKVSSSVINTVIESGMAMEGLSDQIGKH